jgi:hypothetical protein
MTDIKDNITLSFQSNDISIEVKTDAQTTWWDHLDTFMNFLRGMGYHIEEGSWVSGNPEAPESDPPYKKDLEAKDKMITQLLEAIVVLSAKVDSISEERACLLDVLSDMSADKIIVVDPCYNNIIDSALDPSYSIKHASKGKKKATKKKAIKKRSK